MKRTEDELFKELLSTSKLEVPTHDFEDQVMMQIKQLEVYQKQVIPREIKWSWVGMVLIVVLGITISVLFEHLPTMMFDIPLGGLKTVFDFGFVVFVLLQLDALIKYTFRGDTHRLKNAHRES
jgi:polyferredoxin